MVHRVPCKHQEAYMRIYQGPEHPTIGTMCFADAGHAHDLVIADVHRMDSGNNAGYVVTNKGKFDFIRN